MKGQACVKLGLFAVRFYFFDKLRYPFFKAETLFFLSTLHKNPFI